MLGQLGDTDKVRGGKDPGLWMKSSGFGSLEPGGVSEGWSEGASPWGRVTGQRGSTACAWELRGPSQRPRGSCACKRQSLEHMPEAAEGWILGLHPQDPAGHTEGFGVQPISEQGERE